MWCFSRWAGDCVVEGAMFSGERICNPLETKALVSST